MEVGQRKIFEITLGLFLIRHLLYLKSEKDDTILIKRQLGQVHVSVLTSVVYKVMVHRQLSKYFTEPHK